MSKPKVLVLGGVGFIGRNFVKYLVDNDCASFVRVCDKVLPSTAFLGDAHKAAFDNEKVEYKQANLTSVAAIERMYKLDDGSKFNFVFNCAAETKYGQTEEVYAEKVFDLSKKCADEAAKQGVDVFVELSTAQVYSAGSKPSKEESKTDPWTMLAKHKLNAEQALAKISGLNLIVLRLALTYGPGDLGGLSPRLICGAVYQHLGKRMKFLWTGDVRMNTVHVLDVCAAMWHVAEKKLVGKTFNLADKTDTNQEKVCKIIEKVFGIKTGFHGSVKSNLAKLKLKDLTDEANDAHLKPWSDLCKKNGITNTPLTPYIDVELLYNNSLSVDGSAIESTGFSYKNPKLTEELVRDQITYFVNQKLFPPL